jgi:hypothetical protein
MDVGIIGDHPAEEARRREMREKGPLGADRQRSSVEAKLIDHVVPGHVHAVEELPV